MKTLDEIEKTFLKDLKELGVSGFVYGISDPDSTSIFWGIGIDVLWQDGALDWISRLNKLDVPDLNSKEGDEWKGDSDDT